MVSNILLLCTHIICMFVINVHEVHNNIGILVISDPNHFGPYHFGPFCMIRTLFWIIRAFFWMLRTFCLGEQDLFWMIRTFFLNDSDLLIGWFGPFWTIYTFLFPIQERIRAAWISLFYIPNRSQITLIPIHN